MKNETKSKNIRIRKDEIQCLRKTQLVNFKLQQPKMVFEVITSNNKKTRKRNISIKKNSFKC